MSSPVLLLRLRLDPLLLHLFLRELLFLVLDRLHDALGFLLRHAAGLGPRLAVRRRLIFLVLVLLVLLLVLVFLVLLGRRILLGLQRLDEVEAAILVLGVQQEALAVGLGGAAVVLLLEPRVAEIVPRARFHVHRG